MLKFQTIVIRFVSLCFVFIISSLTVGAAEAKTSFGNEGQSLVVDNTTGLDPAGNNLVVTGSGYDLLKGIYLAVCVDNGSDLAPGPCLGGANMSGESKSSVWFSANPPEYAVSLVTPFDEVDGRGSFSSTLFAQANDGSVNCLDPEQAPKGCVVATRADHLRPNDDRTADVVVPVSFVDVNLAPENKNDLSDVANIDNNVTNSNNNTIVVFLGVVAVVVLLGLVFFVWRKKSL